MELDWLNVNGEVPFPETCTVPPVIPKQREMPHGKDVPVAAGDKEDSPKFQSKETKAKAKRAPAADPPRAHHRHQAAGTFLSL